MSNLTPETNAPKVYKPALIIGMCLVILLPVALSSLLWGLKLSNIELMVSSRFIFWAEVGLLYLYAEKVERQDFVLWKSDYPFDFYIKWVIVLYLLSFGAALMSAIPLAFGWHDNTAVLLKWINIIVPRYWLLLFCAVTAGVTEELIMRAYLLPRLTQLFSNKYLPVIISAALFSALHYRYFSLRETIFTFLIGVIFAVHYQKYRNIHVLIIVHFLIDFISFMLARVRFEHGLQHALALIW